MGIQMLNIKMRTVIKPGLNSVSRCLFVNLFMSYVVNS